MQSQAFCSTSVRTRNLPPRIGIAAKLCSNLTDSAFSFDCRKFNSRGPCSNPTLKLQFTSGRRYESRGQVFRKEEFGFHDEDNNDNEDSENDYSFGDLRDHDRVIEYLNFTRGYDDDSDWNTRSERRTSPRADFGEPILTKSIWQGVLNNILLLILLTILMVYSDEFLWKILKLPYEPFYLLMPFLLSGTFIALVGFIFVMFFDMLGIREKANTHDQKGAPTMGGLYFVPVGLFLTQMFLGSSSITVSGAVKATTALAAIGLVEDLSRLNYINYNLPVWMRTMLEVAVGLWFSYWLHTKNISTPYNMKMAIPLPAPMGLVVVPLQHIFTSLCFVSMASGIDLADGLDGLAAGIAALVFIGMSIVVVPICKELAVFGATMAGACFGFLWYNRYNASMQMGKIGAFAIGGALAAMSSCTGLFSPLVIASGVYVFQALTVLSKVLFNGRNVFCREGYQDELGAATEVTEPGSVAAAYVSTWLLVLCAVLSVLPMCN